ncbi:MAG TPA: hypothetical protein VGE08_08860 [Steroidobacter sp.]|uniref:hypothetical protein n=1 Tax=Steroidobacter sp. TaxID=1978227 RepID=UPI002EDB346F
MADTTAIDALGGVRAAPRTQLQRDFVPLLVLCTPIACASVLSKFGIPGYTTLGIGIALPLMMLILAFGMLDDRIRIEPKRLGFYCITLAVLILPQLLQAGTFSLNSLMMLALLHIPYVLVVIRGDELAPKVLAFFLLTAKVLAVLAIAQYFLQGLVDTALLYPIDNLIPQDFVVQGFNAQGTINYHSTQLRATGVFMLEPSFLTQFLAVAIVAESVTNRRLWPLGLYAIGILVAHAGTGILILLICMPFVVFIHRRWDLLALGVVGLAALLAFGELLNLDFIASRAGEFDDPNSSGFARFVGGFHLFDQMLWPDLKRALFGYGAGAFMDYAHLFNIEVADMPMTKMVFEFGVVGAFTYFAFIASSLFASPLPRMLSVAIALTFLLNGMYVPFSHGLALGLLVLTSTRKVQTVAATNLPPKAVRMARG